jgi:hypothetical protein
VLFHLYRNALISLLSLIVLTASAQTLTINGTVSAGGIVQGDVLIDVYEYNSPIQTLHTDSKGAFTFPITRGKEYLAVIYKSGYLLQSYSISDNRLDPMSSYNMKVELAADVHSPDGLYFKDPLRRISPDIDFKSFTESKFQLEQIKPQQRADSVLVLLNRAQANQYILIAKMKMSGDHADDKYSRQVAENINTEIATYASQIAQSNARHDAIRADEDAQVAASLKTKDEVQLNHIIVAQKDLADRLAERANYYLLLQQQQLAKARLRELDVIKFEQQMNAEKDSVRKEELRLDSWRSKAGAVNSRYQAMDANRKFLAYNRYQMLNYQEYIELLRYKQHKNDTARVAAAPKSKPNPAPRATIAAVDTSDNLSKMNDTQRQKVIQAALEEEERFKNYKETKEVKKVDGVNLTVTDIRISDDNYEMQVDKKKNARYFKNGKPVTKLTYEFETKRKMVDVLNTIREVDKFGK